MIAWRFPLEIGQGSNKGGNNSQHWHLVALHGQGKYCLTGTNSIKCLLKVGNFHVPCYKDFEEVYTKIFFVMGQLGTQPLECKAVLKIMFPRHGIEEDKEVCELQGKIQWGFVLFTPSHRNIPTSLKI